MLRRFRENGTLLHCWWKYKLVQPPWKTVWRFLRTLKIKLPYDPAILFLGFLCDSAGKESAYSAGDLGWEDLNPGEGKGYPLQYSGLENSMMRSERVRHDWVTFTFTILTIKMVKQKTYRWLSNTWKDAQHHSLLEKCKSKPQWGTISHQSECLLSKSLQAINAGDGVEKRVPSYSVGGNEN